MFGRLPETCSTTCSQLSWRGGGAGGGAACTGFVLVGCAGNLIGAGFGDATGEGGGVDKDAGLVGAMDLAGAAGL